MLVISIHPNKQITTGEGGVVATDDPEIVPEHGQLGQGRGGCVLSSERLGFSHGISHPASPSLSAIANRAGTQQEYPPLMEKADKVSIGPCAWRPFRL